MNKSISAGSTHGSSGMRMQRLNVQQIGAVSDEQADDRASEREKAVERRHTGDGHRIRFSSRPRAIFIDPTALASALPLRADSGTDSRRRQLRNWSSGTRESTADYRRVACSRARATAHKGCCCCCCCDSRARTQRRRARGTFATRRSRNATRGKRTKKRKR